MKTKLAMAAATVVLTTATAWASGGGSAPAGGGSMSGGSARMTPEQQAAMHYNNGLKAQEKADKLSHDAESVTDPKARGKAESKAQKAYDNARSDYENAIKKDPKMYAAYGALGYVKRRTGDYNGSLESYQRALEIKPGYTPAIEYRGEAYLGLGRIEDAKAAYMQLFSADRKRADELSAAMSKWVEAKKQNPAGVDAKALEEFSGWLNERVEIAKQTAALLPAKDARW
ncbi:MAG TPA: tetratricopeptide repeat protein [Candidatus Polarisedimenticolia bacterium]|nr:tetratricopeptide repeat protein [Candidatus Polarisedimenticolia bacterium]